MDNKKIVEGLIGGILFGFTAGIGFILATRLMTKKITVEDQSKSGGVSIAPMPESSDDSDFSGFNDGVEFSAADFMENNKEKNRPMPNENNWQKTEQTTIHNRNFDFSTGRYL